MEWLRMRMARMALDEREARERSVMRCRPTAVGDDVTDAGGDVTVSEDDAASRENLKCSDGLVSGVEHRDMAAECELASVSNGDTASCGAGQVTGNSGGRPEKPTPSEENDVTPACGDTSHGADRATPMNADAPSGADAVPSSDEVVPMTTDPASDVTPTAADVTPSADDGAPSADDVTLTAYDVTLAADDATLAAYHITQTADDVTPTADDVTPAADDATAGDGCSSDEDEDEDAACDDAPLLRQKLRRRRGQVRGLKRRLAQLERENAALRVRCEPAGPAQLPLDAAAMVEDIKQAAAETAAQLEPAGMVYQAETGLYYDHDSGYYWDPDRGMYYDGASGYYLSYDEASGSYAYVQSAPAAADPGDPAADLCSRRADPGGGSRDPTAARRRKRSGEELEDGEIDEDDEEEDTRQPVADYWTPERQRQAQPEEAPHYSVKPAELAVSVFQSGPRSPHNSREPPWLRMIVTETQVTGLRLGSLYVATMDGLTVGRDPSQQMHLDDANVSKFHAVIGYHADKNDFYIRDLGSRNGTMVDERRISAAKQESADVSLPHTCRLRLGSTCLVCHVHAANDTCLDCEPGQMQQRLAAHVPPAAGGDSRQQRRHVANRIKQKYGLRPGGGAPVAPVGRGYADRAAERRLTIGSDNPFEKTRTADVTQAIPVKNRGFKLLQQMGWKEGSGLGRAGQGIVEPITVEERGERRGLGCAEPVLPPVGHKEKRKAEVWQKTQERFRKLV